MAAAFTAGCSSTKNPTGLFNRPKDPKIQVAAVNVTEQTEEGVRLEVVLNVENPNSIALPLDTIKYTVDVPGIGRFRMTDQANHTLPTEGRQTLVLPAALTLSGKSRDVHGATYRVHGRIAYQRPETFIENLAEEKLPLPKAHFKSSGQLP
ncbi:MAG: hypothetical protein IT443_09640 [Phycisphaeraceae bacterium]|nr:hypothetical protein [Phycisphaeraceae bacterium]